jgi:hypothetical protein
VGAGEHGVTPIRTYSEAEARALGLITDEVPELDEDAKPARKANGSFIDNLRKLTVIR